MYSRNIMTGLCWFRHNDMVPCDGPILVHVTRLMGTVYLLQHTRSMLKKYTNCSYS